jgi:hypothetical protein
MVNLHNIPIRIADILVELTSPLSAGELGIERWLGPYRAVGAPEKALARLALRWEECENAPVPPGDLIYDPGSIWTMYRAGPDCYAALTYHGEGHAALAHSVLRANPGWDDLVLTEQRTGSQWGSLLNIGAGELILRTAILFNGGLVFHSAAIDDNGRGIVIVGHSGEGKSTQANFWNQVPGALVINEDRIAVRSSESGVLCYGTPWGSTANVTRNHSAPLSALILLEKAPENDIQRLSPSASAPLLLARAFLPYWDRTLMERAMANLNALLARVPVYRLRCRPEPEVVSLVRSVL